jgi:hypothetical protein
MEITKMSQIGDDVKIQKQANSIVLYAALVVNFVLIIYAIYLTATIGAMLEPTASIVGLMWEFSTSSSMLYHGVAILTLIIIGVLHAANQAIGQKSPLIEKIAGILLKLPINLILICFALFFAYLGYGKFATGVTSANLLGGGYILDWITAAAQLFLVFFVKKV